MSQFGVFILLNEVTGEKKGGKIKKKTHLSVPKGELLVEAPKKQKQLKFSRTVISTDTGASTDRQCARYFVLRNPEIRLYASGANVAPLIDAEADYLEAVKDPLSRVHVYEDKDRLQWAMNLKNGDDVYLKLEGDDAAILVLGKVRYYGPTKRERGVMFGVEITVSMYSKPKPHLRNLHVYAWSCCV